LGCISSPLGVYHHRRCISYGLMRYNTSCWWYTRLCRDDIQRQVVDFLSSVWYNKSKKGGKTMFGAIYGDMVGSYYEVHCAKNYNFEFNNNNRNSD